MWRKRNVSILLIALLAGVSLPWSIFAQQLAPAPLPPIHPALFGDVALPDSAKTADDTSQSANARDKDDELDFLDKDIRELSQTRVNAPAMSTEVTSVSRQTGTVGRSPCAVFVITSEMIRRSGSTCVPELLRMAPGVSVAKISSHSWAIAIRGQQGRFNKLLLVMIDGRSVYNPFFGGTYWDMQDMPLENIERIEVIRGPGGTIWGANAVDGVINIITKKASDTQGIYVQAGGGNYDLLNDAVRVGGSNGDGLQWRLWGKHFERGPGYLPGLGHAWDDWRGVHSGFRVDWDVTQDGRDQFTALGSYSDGAEGQVSDWPTPIFPYYETTTEDMTFANQNVLLRWNHQFDEDSDWTLQTFYDRSFRNQLAGGKEMWTTMDYDFQHRFPLGDRHSVIWGLEYRETASYAPDGGFFLSFSPAEISYRVFSGFIQDEIELVKDRWFLTVGTKLERNNFSGFEVQPSIRLLWSPDERHAVWGAVSRPVSTPAVYQETSTMNLGPLPTPIWPTFARAVGNPNFESEKMLAYEVGYRAQVNERFSWDLATYYNVYSELNGLAMDGFYPENTYWVLQYDWTNSVGGTAYGVELSASWNVTDTWRLWGFYGYQHVHWDATPAETLFHHDGIIPLNQARLQSSWSLAEKWDFDAVLRYVDNLPGQDIPRYLTMDLRLAWRPTKHCEAAIMGQNLFSPHHWEFGPESYGLGVTEVRRTVFGQLTLRH
ncbi:MAG: TonB-dependent receptor [Pirellulales bacterium]|nr:TonB-dependent receptor [Pirellulales bacterium]